MTNQKTIDSLEKTIAEMRDEFLSEELTNKREAEKHLEKALELVQKQIENYENLYPCDAYSYFERLEQLIQYVFEDVRDDDIIEDNDEHRGDIFDMMLMTRERARYIKERNNG